jgi:hypothetical protein
MWQKCGKCKRKLQLVSNCNRGRDCNPTLAPGPVAETPKPQQVAPDDPATATGEAVDSSTGAPEIVYPNARIVPYYRIMHGYGLSDNLGAVIAAQVTFATPFAILILQLIRELYTA